MKKYNIEDYIGKKVNSLTVVKEVFYISKSSKRKVKQWLCKCDCGNMTTPTPSAMFRGKSNTCGCLQKEQLIKRSKKHGMSRSPEYDAWSDMKDRCYNERNKYYKNYGGRNIKVCDRWINSFENFFEDLGFRPSKEYSLDREDVNGNYEPKNVKWATLKEQGCHKTTNRILNIGDEYDIITNWSRKFNITLTYMLKFAMQGYSLLEILKIRLDYEKSSKPKRSNYRKSTIDEKYVKLTNTLETF